MVILGIGGLLNDAACALLKDGQLIAAVEQKRLARHHRRGELPQEAIAACLEIAKVRPEQVDCVALVRPLAAGARPTLNIELRSRFANSRVVVVEHHMAHAASAYYCSPFDHAQVLTLDRMGDFRCGALWEANGTQIEIGKELYYPDSLGDLYGRVTALLGYRPNADEHKVQWMSTSGEPRFAGLFDRVLSQGSGEWPQVDRSYFDVGRLSAGGFSGRFYREMNLEDEAAIPDAVRTDLAASLQQTIEKTVIAMVPASENLALAGGLFFNVLLVHALESSGKWKNVFVQPAAGNPGTAIGAVCHAWHAVYRQKRRTIDTNLCLGPQFAAEDIKRVLENCKLRFRLILTNEELVGTAVRELNDHKIIAWMQGRMEFGPRALGNRSILASPRDPYSTENLNIYIKHREPYRKFAASVPLEHAADYFEVGPNARYIATVGKVRPEHRETFRSAILGEDLIRVHTVSETDNPAFHRLLKAAGASTGLPVLYNTSFNLFSDPLVCSPRDAVRSFYSSGIDAMIVGNFLLEK
jgi:carbamoyltransferase